MEWIKVEDKLPEQYVDVFVYYGQPVGSVAHRLGEKERGEASNVWPELRGSKNVWDSADLFRPITTVTHWMPLPEPPKTNEP